MQYRMLSSFIKYRLNKKRFFFNSSPNGVNRKVKVYIREKKFLPIDLKFDINELINEHVVQRFRNLTYKYWRFLKPHDRSET